MKKTTNKNISGKAVAIGVGAVALAAATYYFFGPKGKQHRNALKGWMIKMKGEIIERMEKAKDMTEGLYHKIVDTVAARYGKGGVSPEEVKQFAEELKKSWKGFTRSGVSKKGAHAPSKKSTKKRAS